MNSLTANSARSAFHLNSDYPETVLVVDDQPMMLHLLQCTLGHLGYNVMAAADGAEALAIASGIESFRILITDVNLDGMSGIELAEELRAARPELKTIYISGSSREEFEDLGVDMSQSAFVAKPFSLRQVSEAIRALTHDEGFVSSRTRDYSSAETYVHETSSAKGWSLVA